MGVKLIASATYKILQVTDNLVLIVDLDVGRSVTNDAEAVIAELDRHIDGGLKTRRVYYRDTTGRFDELKHRDGEFIGYYPCSISQQEFLKGLV